MSGRRPLVHVLYTNAPGTGPGVAGLGFRTLAVPSDGLDGWPAEDRCRLERFLVDLGPGRTGGGVAAHCLRLGGLLRACLVRSVPGFDRDAHGRGGGRLLHAVLVPVEEGSDRCVHHQALLAAGTPGGEVGAGADLDGYVEACRRADAVRLHPLDPSVLGALLQEARPAVAAFLAATAVQGARPELALPAPRRELPELLAGAVAALPPRLRLAARWTVGFEGGGDGFVRVRAEEGAAPPAPPPPVAGYLDRLGAVLESGRTAAAEGWLHDWQIRSWGELARRVEEEG